MRPSEESEQALERLVREDWARILAALVKSVGDIQLAEDCLQEALISASVHWARTGLPRVPAAWVVTVARRKAIDRIRRDRNFASKQADLAYLIELDQAAQDEDEPMHIPDKRLELIFTCCHPAIAQKTRVALTLRALGGLKTEEIAGAFLDKPTAMEQRLTRARAKIRDAGIAYKVPEPEDLPARLSSVLNTIYLMFNEGYAARSGGAVVRADLCMEAIRLCKTLVTLMPDEAEVAGLLALMLLHDSRREARSSQAGQMIPLQEQDRSLWNAQGIREGVALLERTLRLGRVGPFQLQAAISGVHALSESWEMTDWQEIVALYEVLAKVQPSPVVDINRAVALCHAGRADDALEILDGLERDKKLEGYQPFHTALAEALSETGQVGSAHDALLRAIDLTQNEAERLFLENKAKRWAARLH